MADPVYLGDLALLDALPGADALAALHLARRASGPVLLAQTCPAAAAVQPGWPAAAAAAKALAEPKTTALLPIVHAQAAPQPALAYRLFAAVQLSAVLRKSQQDGMPIAADLALLICERIAEGIGKLPPGVRHLLLTGGSVLVGFEGEIAVIDAPLSAALAGRPLSAAELGEWRAARLHKSVLAGKPAPRAELWQIGAMLLEMAGGEPFSTGGDVASTIDRLCRAQEVPADVREVIERSLVENAEAFRTLDEMKQAIGRLIYQGAYNPSSFNLAYFMHTLFRGEDEAFAAKVKSFAALPLAFPAAPPPSGPEKKPPPAKPKAPPPVLSFGTVTGGDEGGPSPPDLPPAPAGGAGRGLLMGGSVGLVVLAGGGWLMWSKLRSQNAEIARREAALQAQQAQVAQEREKLDAAKKEASDLQAREEAQQRLVSEAKTAAEKKQAEEEAARLAERRRKVEEKSRQLQAAVEEKAQAVRLAAVAKPKAVEPPPAPPASPPAGAPAAHAAPAAESSIAAAPPPQPAAEPVKEIYSPAEVDLPASLKGDTKAEYPSRGRGSATVIVRCTVDIAGNVVDAQVTKGDSSGLGFNEAALAAARRMRFAPAIKNGRPVKSYVTKTFPFKG